MPTQRLPPAIPPPLPNENPYERRWRAVSITLIGCLSAIYLISMLFLIPVFGAMFSDFGARLPAPTQIVLDLSSHIKRWWWIETPFLVTTVITLFNFFESRLGRERATGILRIAIVVQVIGLVLLLVAMFLPIFQLGAVAEGAK